MAFGLLLMMIYHTTSTTVTMPMVIRHKVLFSTEQELMVRGLLLMMI